MNIILASSSPRRAKILSDRGVAFTIVKTNAPETNYPDDPERTVRENALAKGAAVKGDHVLSADTIVWCDGRIYGKPRDLDEAKAFLRELSGRTHTVFTGVAYDGAVVVCRSFVTFRELSDAEIEAYVQRVKPTDRAGAYDIDESGETLVARWSGSYENIMGLPVEPLVAWGIVQREGESAPAARPQQDAQRVPPGPDETDLKGIVFDFGGVMTTCTMPERVKPIVDELGISWAALEEGFAKYRRLMDGGFMGFDEMYRKIWADAGVEIDAATQAKILEEDMASFLYPNLRTLAWMRALKARGYKIGILTNMWADFGKKFRETFPDFIALADAMVVSGEEHMYKPQRQIYDLLRTRIALPAESLVFIDDAPGNCDGARQAGWKALRFISNDQVESDFQHGLWR